MKMKTRDREELVKVLGRQAMNLPAGIIPYFRQLVMQADLNDELRGQIIGAFQGDPEFDARTLVTWALNVGTNPSDNNLMIGTIISPLLSRSGVEDALFLASMIICYDLVRSPDERAELAERYQVPQHPEAVPKSVELGPTVSVIGPADQKTLEGFLQKEPDFLDVWLLKNAVDRSRSVCRVEVPEIGQTGSGVLIDRDLVLTNFHVLARNPVAALAELKANAATVRLRFGAFRSEGAAADGQVVDLDPENPIVASSPVQTYDFVLLRAKKDITSLTDVTSTPFTTRIPRTGSALNILQHPEGGTMKLALSSNGVSAADIASGLIQYVTRTEEGSSGSPCFDADWKLIALHHARMATTWGSIREGILMKSIYDQIVPYLKVNPS